MTNPFSSFFSDNSENVKGRIIRIYAVLIGANIVVWTWAILTFRGYPVQMGTAFLAYALGLRHAVDADHIAAIDNVTRKLMQEGKRPIAVGFFFSLGHSTIVVLASVVIALAATAFKTTPGKDQLGLFGSIGGIIGTLFSATFLIAIAILNVFILVGLWRTFRRVKTGGRYGEEDLDILLAKTGILARIFRPFFRATTHSWQMYPLGFLFGLGFDTATEVGLLGIAAASASQDLPIWSILLFPALFTVGMSLLDTTDGILMLGAYGWAFVKPVRKLFYNMAITAVSALVALVVGMLETLNLIGTKLELTGTFWEAIGAINDKFGLIGLIIIGIFAVAWPVSFLIYKIKRYDQIQMAAPLPSVHHEQ